MNQEYISLFSKDYMYFRAIQFIYEMKQGPFHEHSPILYDISGVLSWSKVNGGMLKMYAAECLRKFPIIQVPTWCISYFLNSKEPFRFWLVLISLNLLPPPLFFFRIALCFWKFDYNGTQ